MKNRSAFFIALALALSVFLAGGAGAAGLSGGRDGVTAAERLKMNSSGDPSRPPKEETPKPPTDSVWPAGAKSASPVKAADGRHGAANAEKGHGAPDAKSVVSEGPKFSFVCMSDSRSEKEDDSGVNEKALSKIVSRSLRMMPEFVIYPGDIVYGSNDFERYKGQIANFKRIIAPLERRCRVHYAFGNHELRSPDHADYILTQFETIRNSVGKYSGHAYSFKYKGCLFVAVATSLHTEDGLISDEQMKWLRGVLDENRDAPHKFVFGHSPAFPSGPHVLSSLDMYPERRNAFWRLLREYDVDAYFCGHEHFYQTKRVAGVYQVMAGTCGAPIYKGYGGEFHHFIRIDVDGPAAVFSVYDEDGVMRDRVTLKRSGDHKDHDDIDLAEAENQPGPAPYLVEMDAAKAVKVLEGDHRFEMKAAALDFFARECPGTVERAVRAAFADKYWMTRLFGLYALDAAGVRKPAPDILESVRGFAAGKPYQKETMFAKKLLKGWGLEK